MGICLHGFKMDLTMNLMVAQWNMIRMTWIHNIDRLDWIGLDWIRFLVGGFKHVLCSIIYGMSSFPLTFIFFKMVIAPPTSDTCWNVPIPLLGWVWTSHIIAGVIMAQSCSCLPDILTGKSNKKRHQGFIQTYPAYPRIVFLFIYSIIDA